MLLILLLDKEDCVKFVEKIKLKVTLCSNTETFHTIIPKKLKRLKLKPEIGIKKLDKYMKYLVY